MSIRTRLSRRSAFATIGGAALAPAALGAGLRAAHAEGKMLGNARPKFYRFQRGQLEVTTLLDGAIQLDGPHPIFGEDQPAEAVRELASANFLPPDKMEIGFTPILVNTGSELILFDTGNPAARRPDAAQLVASLEAAGYGPDQVDTVVISHMHGDHIGGLMGESGPTYPNARVLANQIEYEFWSAEERLSGPTEGNAQLVQANVVPLRERIEFVAPDQEVASGITVIEAYGHTPGHMAFHLESEGERLLIWADTANHYVVSVQRPEWHVRFDMDKEQAVATRKRLLDLANAERLPVQGYHMPFPALGFIDKTDAGYRFVQASYQLDL